MDLLVNMCGLFFPGPVWCRRTDHSKRACIQASQWRSDRESIHIRPHSGWCFTGNLSSLLHLVIFKQFPNTVHNSLSFSADTPDIRERVHRGCRDEAGGPAGSWKSTIHCWESEDHFMWLSSGVCILSTVQKCRQVQWIHWIHKLV